MTAIKKYIFCAVAVWFLLLGFMATAPVRVFAATSSYSDVLEDLQTDSDFDVSEYPETADKYGMQVIQIAESTGGELLIYVYQPKPEGQTKELRASSINIAREMDNSSGLGFQNYELEYLNSNGVFYKYKVKDFELRSDALRYYNISQIMRPFDEDLDDSPENGNTISEVPYAVEQFWTAATVNGEVSYTMVTTETVTIKNKYVGFVRYSDGVDYWGNKIGLTDGHFVAFSTVQQIDKLMEAQIEYCTQTRVEKLGHVDSGNYLTWKYEYGEKSAPIKITIKADQFGSNTADGWFAEKYTFNRIQSTSNFIASEDNDRYELTTEGVSDISGTQWILRFVETDYTQQYYGSPANGTFGIKQTSTIVSDVIILRLKFETDGVTYNLGVIDNKQTGDGIPDNSPVAPDILWWVIYYLVWFGFIIIAVVIVIAAVMLLISFAPSVLAAIVKLLAKIGTGIVKVITLPFRAIATLFRKE